MPTFHGYIYLYFINDFENIRNIYTFIHRKCIHLKNIIIIYKYGLIKHIHIYLINSVSIKIFLYIIHYGILNNLMCTILHYNLNIIINLTTSAFAFYFDIKFKS